jgi:DNA-directed RNA polymerase specialized sigma24 family protein
MSCRARDPLRRSTTKLLSNNGHDRGTDRTMPHRPEDEGADQWSADTFLTRWALIEQRFLNTIARFGIPDRDAADMTQEVLERLVRARVTPNTPHGLLRLAEATAQRIVLDRLRRERIARVEVGDEAVEDALLPEDALLAVDAEEWALRREALRGAIASLSAEDRRVFALILRGGPYTSTERSLIKRSRARLRAAFRSLFAGAAVRLSNMRDRYAEPPPLVPLITGALIGAALGGYVPSGATTVPSNRRPAQQFQNASRQLRGAAGREPADHAAQDTGARIAVGAPQAPNRASAPDRLPFSGSAGLTRDATASSAAVTVAASDHTPGGTTWFWVHLYCDSPTRQIACAAAAPASDAANAALNPLSG